MDFKKLLRLKELLIIFILLSLTLGYLGRINFGNVFVGLYFWDILVLIYVAISLPYTVKGFGEKFRLKNFPKFYIFIFLFTGWALITTLNSYRFLSSSVDWIISSMYLGRFLAYTLFGYFLFLDLKFNVIKLNFLKKILYIEGALIIMFGFVQLIVLPDFTVLSEDLLWDPHKNRLTALYFDPNFAGIILISIFSLVASEVLSFFEREKSLQGIKPLVILALVLFIAIILTFSRSAWLALAVVALIVGLIRYKWVIPLALLAMFLVYYAVPRVQTRIAGVTDPSDSFYFRLISWRETTEVAARNPIWGYGFNTYRYIRQELGYIDYDEGLGDRSDSGSDSSLLFVWVTSGIIGLVIYMFAYVSLIFNSLKFSKSNMFSLFLVAFLISLFINSQFINSMFFPALLLNLYVLIGIHFSQKL